MSATATRHRQRERRHECGRYIRFVGKQRMRKYQVRLWIGEHGQVNCGLYYDEWTAERVRDLVVRRLKTLADLAPLPIWRHTRAVLAELAAKGHQDLPDPLPRYVWRCTGGVGYCARVSLRGRRIVCPGPYPDPLDAHLAIADRLAREFPPR